LVILDKKPVVKLYCIIEDVTMDAEGRGYIIFKKERKKSLETSIKMLRLLKGLSTVIMFYTSKTPNKRLV